MNQTFILSSSSQTEERIRELEERVDLLASILSSSTQTLSEARNYISFYESELPYSLVLLKQKVYHQEFGRQ